MGIATGGKARHHWAARNDPQPASMPTLNSLLIPAAIVTALYAGGSDAPRHRAAPPANPVSANENRAAAGAMHGGILEVSLEVRAGEWRPYGPGGPAVGILAFGETGKGLQTPGPLIRVRAGTHIHVRVRNTVEGTLVVHGLTAHHSAMPDTVVVPPGETRDIAFTADDEGTFFYWATTTGAGLSKRLFEDAQLNGALIVDPRTGTPRPDRVFVVQWSQPKALPPKTGGDGLNGFFTFNGMPWPGTERLHYAQGDSIRWRFINATPDMHPLHLHGFYFRVTARGDANRDTLYWPAQERMGVTELMGEGTTMNLAWYADRPGAWLFHCHLNWHVVPNPALGDARLPDSTRLRELFSAPAMQDMQGMRKSPAMANHSETGMGGLLLRMDIAPAANWRPYSGPRERLHLYIQSDSQPGDTLRRFGYALAHGNDTPAPNAIQWPGPPIILHKGQPTSIVVINHIAEPSQVHWHGLELDSYYDGVAGLSSNAGMVSPMIMPRDSFEMTVTPPRAGSFMYHTHVNDMRQQSHGLYGPIVVLPAGQAWDPTSDLIFQTGSSPTDDAILNGSASPPALTLPVGRPYRIRLMNVSLDEWFNELRLTEANGTMPFWTAIAKDGFDLPVWQQVESRAHQRVTIGETHDFRITFKSPGEYAMVGSSDDGSVFARQVIHVVP
jgi:FtsP/CotA-like multicopper oxidase with cupredoxin domain